MAPGPSALTGPLANILSRGSQIPMSLGDEAGMSSPVVTPVPVPRPNNAIASAHSPTSSKVDLRRLDAQRQYGVSPTGANEVANGQQFSRLGDQTIFFRNGGTVPSAASPLAPSQARVLIQP